MTPFDLITSKLEAAKAVHVKLLNEALFGKLTEGWVPRKRTAEDRYRAWADALNYEDDADDY